MMKRAGFIFFSIGMMGLCALVIHGHAAIYRGPEANSLIALTLSTYLILSQICAFGIPFSVLSKASAAELQSCSSVQELISATVCVGALSSMMLCLIFVIQTCVSGYIQFDPILLKSIGVALLGLPCSALNKVLVSFLVGSERFGALAAMSSIRAVVWCGLSMMILTRDLPLWWFGAALAISDVMFVPVHLIIMISNGLGKNTLKKAIEHFNFGRASVLGATANELNSKADVLILSIYVEPWLVGVYSIAAITLEGAFQLIHGLRILFNKWLTRILTEVNAFQEIKKFIKSMYMCGLSIFVLIQTAYFIITYQLGDVYQHDIVSLSFLITSTAMFVLSPLLISELAFNQSNAPGWQSRQRLLAIAVNVIVGFALAPALGPLGTSLGVVSSMVVVGAFVCIAFARKGLTRSF